MKTRHVFAFALGLALGSIADALDARGRARRGWLALFARMKGRT